MSHSEKAGELFYKRWRRLFANSRDLRGRDGGRVDLHTPDRLTLCHSPTDDGRHREVVRGRAAVLFGTVDLARNHPPVA